MNYIWIIKTFWNIQNTQGKLTSFLFGMMVICRVEEIKVLIIIDLENKEFSGGQGEQSLVGGSEA